MIDISIVHFTKVILVIYYDLAVIEKMYDVQYCYITIIGKFNKTNQLNSKSNK